MKGNVGLTEPESGPVQSAPVLEDENEATTFDLVNGVILVVQELYSSDDIEVRLCWWLIYCLLAILLAISFAWKTYGQEIMTVLACQDMLTKNSLSRESSRQSSLEETAVVDKAPTTSSSNTSKQQPGLPTQSEVTPYQSGATPTQSAATPTHTIATPTPSAVSPTHTVPTPTQSAAMPTHRVATPTQSGARPTQTLVTPTYSKTTLSQHPKTD